MVQFLVVWLFRMALSGLFRCVCPGGYAYAAEAVRLFFVDGGRTSYYMPVRMSSTDTCIDNTELMFDPKGVGAFVVLLIGQFASLLGSGLTGFALGVWVFQRTGSVTDFAVMSRKSKTNIENYD